VGDVRGGFQDYQAAGLFFGISGDDLSTFGAEGEAIGFFDLDRIAVGIMHGGFNGSAQSLAFVAELAAAFAA
jgi:hypothetical protein